MTSILLRIVFLSVVIRLNHAASPFGYNRHQDHEEEEVNNFSTNSTEEISPSDSTDSISSSKTSTTSTKTTIRRKPAFIKSSSFFSSFLPKNGVTDEESSTDADLVLGSNSTSQTKYIKISSSIEIPESESLLLVIDALKVLWSAGITSVKNGLFPTLERVRRDTRADTKKGKMYLLCVKNHFSQADCSGLVLDWIIDMIGALIGRQECSLKVACRAGRLAQERVPGSQMMIIMMESFVPPGLMSWFSVVKNSVLDHFSECGDTYECDFSDVHV